MTKTIGIPYHEGKSLAADINLSIQENPLLNDERITADYDSNNGLMIDCINTSILIDYVNEIDSILHGMGLKLLGVSGHDEGLCFSVVGIDEDV